MVENKHYPLGFEDRLELAKVVPLPVPLLVQCEPTSICNLKCHYCIHGKAVRIQPHTMKPKLFDLLCDQIKEFGEPIKQFNFCGWGEPLINPYLPGMIKKAIKRKIARNVAVVTNGLLLGPRMSKKLVDAGLNTLRISLQGLTTERYRQVTRKNVEFEDLLNSIARFYKNRGDCELIVKFADTEISERDEQFFHNVFDPITDRAYIEYIRPVFDPAEDTTVSRYGVKHDPTLICPQPFYMMDVNARGDVFPCCSYFSPLIDTNIQHISLKKVWDGTPMKYLRLMQLSGKRKTQFPFGACRECNIPGANIGPGDDLVQYAKEIKRRLL